MVWWVGYRVNPKKSDLEKKNWPRRFGGKPHWEVEDHDSRKFLMP